MASIDLTTVRAVPGEARTPLVALQLYKAGDRLSGSAARIDAYLDGAFSRALERGDFRGEPEETLTLFAPADRDSGGPERVLLIGAGKPDEYTVELLRRGVAAAVRAGERLRVEELAVAFDHLDRLNGRIDFGDAAIAAAEAAVLAAWEFTELKAQPDAASAAAELERVALVARDGEGERRLEQAARRGLVRGSAENLARTLAARPGNVATPSHLAEAAAAIADAHGLEITVLDRAGILDEGLGSLAAVASGSAEEPRFIVLEYRGAPPERPPLALVGKGVTFDAGGISLKPPKKMEEMKYDMAGAAAVLGAIRGVAALDLPVNLVAIIPSTENLPSGTAVKPGDVIRAHGDRSIEVINTDAEGRLILADALSYAQRYEPSAMLDAATLTGACVTALGHHAVGLMGADDSLIEEVRAAGERTGERCWPLPLWDAYRAQLDSEVADIRNTGGRPAGAITAGWFLREFAGDAPWAHLDIAGTAWLDEPPPYLRKGPSGVPTRLFIEWVAARSAAEK